ncbi:hypothetical protein EYZ11_003004 [Aspergillus tanneri]|uniref:Uncharacterized protein n=1 Tax=Aspergillus tanneri TaxID=1220188 RepID=A0A4V3UQ38_9EURO|nr:uncharacterized protein ATNIH1004_007923 [Aspergillus tanneri]KAA8646490.1 hypothetical protein ATNIH1004_007923 [Aspergillus tanneri]THC97524.1 hypothetical protein EYZ11_003004 [Aspergillus tanneri]
MSMDAGGLAQMTYNSSFNNGSSLGAPGSGFGSRRKGANIKRLSVPPPHISTIDESQPSAPVPTPRTSRSHLLAGLRTAPKSATVPSASQRQHQLGMEGDRYGNHANRIAQRVPQTAMGTGFPRHSFAMSQNQDMNQGRPMYTLPEQVLAPPTIDIAGDMNIDESVYAELMSTNLFLAAQQQRLQQQLVSVTAATQQFQGLNLGMPTGLQQQQELPSLSLPGVGFYQQQLQQGVQPVVQPVLSQPGLFSVYNPLTGQQNYVYDNSFQQDGSLSPYQEEEQPSAMQVPTFRAEVSPPPESTEFPESIPQSVSPPSASSSPPREAAPLPPPSANAFRRGHKRSSSFNQSPKVPIDTARANANTSSAAPKTAALPPTPATGTFGPGQGRAGEHPIRQPRGPPSLEELVAKPTSKHEGSKNFATRQRRRAVHNLVRAGIERRGENRSLGCHSSGGTNTPASENEFTFSDGDDVTVRSGSLSSKPSLGSLRAAANGAIGSERKERSSRERRSQESPYNTPVSEDGGFFGGRFADVRTGQVSPPAGSPSVAAVVAGQKTVAQGSGRRKTPMLVLSSAEKRKTPIM